jgi:D-alanyl-lipoteichoic acid acyltransferase DltB (MBOAT superfamily)
MAIGLARMFGITLPLNFFSPYRSTSIVMFWRRWHITLSRFLRDFIYVPLGGNRHGRARRYANLMITMLIGGLWHGAGWTFVFWGALHGLYLCVNHVWRALPFVKSLAVVPQPLRGLAAWAITFAAVVIAWVFFRAPDFRSALVVLKNMFAGSLQSTGFALSGYTEFMFMASMLIALTMPNAYQWLREYQPALHFEHRPEDVFAFVRFSRWTPSFSTLLLIVTMAYWAIASLDENREFIYFRF